MCRAIYFRFSVDTAARKEYTVIEQLKKCSNVPLGGRCRAGRKVTMKECDGKDISRAEGLPEDDAFVALAELFKVFGDPTRAKILGCLQVRSRCVGEIASALGMSISAVSHQLRVLRAAKLVRGVKEGKEVKYSLDDDHVTKIMECGLSHVKEER